MSEIEEQNIEEATTSVKSPNNNELWPEIKKIFESKRYELILSGAEISKRIEDNQGQLKDELFKLKHINFLEISKTPLNILSNKISQLANLGTLILQKNQFEQVPSEIGQLKQLTHLDLSSNKITSLPESFKDLCELKTLNLSGNQLNGLFPLSALSKLATIYLSRNKFTKLPDDICSPNLLNLSQIDASYNEICELNENFYELPSLKLFNLDTNQIKVVPAALCKCIKLKDLLLKNNKLQDNRLKKLIDQDKQKAIMDYLERQYEEECKKASKKPVVANNKTTTNKKATNTVIEDVNQINVVHCADEKLKSIDVFYVDTVTNVRPHLVCCIVRNIDLKTEGNFKKFLTLQTKIHEETCQKRTLGTIATHDLNLIKGTLFYEAIDPNRIQFTPLGRTNIMTADDYYQQLIDEAEAERKAKKRNQVSGIYKYLSLLENKQTFALLRDSQGTVISLPPLSNSESTRMSTQTTDIFVEITSAHSMDTCKKIMEELIIGMFENGLCSPIDSCETIINHLNDKLKLNDNATVSSASKSDDAPKIKNKMIIQQVKLLDSKSSLKNVYPSRTDLAFGNSNKIQVVRLYDGNSNENN